MEMRKVRFIQLKLYPHHYIYMQWVNFMTCRNLINSGTLESCFFYRVFFYIIPHIQNFYLSILCAKNRLRIGFENPSILTGSESDKKRGILLQDSMHQCSTRAIYKGIDQMPRDDCPKLAFTITYVLSPHHLMHKN